MQWHDIEGYEGLYQISEEGDIRSIKYSPRLVEAPANEQGYKVANLSRKGKMRRHKVHRLLYESFVGKIPEGYVVHHLDRNRQNNVISNLILMEFVEHQKFHRNLRKEFLR